MIDQIHRDTGHAIRPICKVLGVPRSSFYHAATPTATTTSDSIIGDRIEQIFREHFRRYGYRRIYAELFDEGLVCGPTRVRRLMVERGLRALQAKNYVPRTSDGKADKPSPNRLLNAAMPTAPDTVWAGDITFISTTGGWLSLAVATDLCSRRIVRWSIADNLRAELVEKAFQQAVKSRRPRPGSFSTVTGAVNMAANSSEASLRRPRHFRVSPQRPTLTTTSGPNRPQGDRQPQAA